MHYFHINIKPRLSLQIQKPFGVSLSNPVFTDECPSTELQGERMERKSCELLAGWAKRSVPILPPTVHPQSTGRCCQCRNGRFTRRHAGAILSDIHIDRSGWLDWIGCANLTLSIYLEGPLWEIRMKGKDGISRALYVTARPKRVVVVRVFVKKTAKTLRREIELALKRAEEIKDDQDS
ncbi:MAG: type II toxin-antitoxin system RelE/ParE family toxin [Streptococcus sp.]|nr:type II toxin-antitoxin system RelE/ParE family toxin [Streptococcus sp.]